MGPSAVCCMAAIAEGYLFCVFVVIDFLYDGGGVGAGGPVGCKPPICVIVESGHELMNTTTLVRR